MNTVREGMELHTLSGR